MKTYKIHEVKTNLSRIIKEVQEGETVYLAKSNKIVAELKPYNKGKNPFPFGLYEGKIHLKEDWDSTETNEEIASLFNDPG